MNSRNKTKAFGDAGGFLVFARRYVVWRWYGGCDGKAGAMNGFGAAVLIGLGVGFLWGMGCSLAILYSIYLGGYRKAVEDSLAEAKPRRWNEAMKRVVARRER